MWDVSNKTDFSKSYMVKKILEKVVYYLSSDYSFQ
ncbi:hypothetical protein NEOC65_002433 [Neochlamydia sp. AcF65]|nr:hypothetical protein [Neochlamydia sp. AcF65]MBS4169522.1 hypothetical protein [Neochlamydia sp. AcF95]